MTPRQMVQTLRINASVAQRNAEAARKAEAERQERELMAWLADGPDMNAEGDQ